MVTVIFSSINIKSSVEEMMIHQGSTRHYLIMVGVVCPPAVDTNEDDILRIGVSDGFLPFLYMVQQMIMKSKLIFQICQVLFEQPQKVRIHSLEKNQV